MRILVSGVMGFIGSYFAKWCMLNNKDIEIVGVNRLTNNKNLKRLEPILDDNRFTMHFLDIIKDPLSDAFQDVDVVVNFAAKTFVDYSIQNAGPFVQSNLVGTFNMLEEARHSKSVKLFIHVGTDEVYGAILEGAYKEDSRLNPSNPYAATKAGADMLVVSYKNTYGMPVIITRTENNYGPFQGREKVIPTFVRKTLNNEPLPVFGDGKHRRQWLFVEDHCTAIMHLIDHGSPGQIYHIAGSQELENLELARRILKIMDKPENIKFIPDHDARPGHDRRYALDSSKIRATGWEPQWSLDKGLEYSVKWYMNNLWWSQ